jgi:hypothetical protein
MISPVEGLWKLIAPGFCALVIGGVLAWNHFRRRPTDAERERRRRLGVNARGRMVDGSITDVHDHVVYYSYSVGGVDYVAAQDLTGLADSLADAAAALGPATVKYVPGNPANSIVVCENWSGLRSYSKGRS